MECQSVREQLNILCDGERLASARLHLAVARHCLGCAACRAVARRLKRDRRDARGLLDLPTPSGLKARVMASLPVASPVAVPTRPLSRPLFSTVARVAVGALLAAALLTTVPWRGSRGMAAEVAAAVGRANTWHLSGWKLQDGHRVPWEIWGRRRPYFYWEQSGEALILDDGHRRVQTIRTWEDGPSLFAVRIGSRGGADEFAFSSLAMGEQSPLTMAEPWRAVRPAGQTAEVVEFRLAETDLSVPGHAAERHYTIDRRTWLPIHYEWRRDVGGQEWIAEALSAEYDVAIPAAVTAQRLPAGIPVVDGLAPPLAGSLPTENMQSARGLTAQITPLAIDPDGNILISLRCWLGLHQLGVGQPWIDFNADQPLGFRGGRGQPEPFRTDDGRVYIQVPLRSEADRSDGAQLLLFAPLQPLTKGAPLPRALTASLSISPGVMELVSPTKREMMGKSLFTQELTWAVRLPEKVSSIHQIRDPEFTQALEEARANRLRMRSPKP